MLYIIAKILTNIFYRVYYKLEFKGQKNIPYNKPVILAPNHVNGFVDPVSIAMLLPKKVRFFARGDVFKSRPAKWILNKLNISPMYRIQEGYSELKKNDKTFEECRKLLSENKMLLLFPEAICVQEQRIRPLKKGVSRIIFQAEELWDFKKEVYIVPIGLNYSAPTKFRSKLFINFGEPMSIKAYEELYKQDKVKAINDFTKELEKEMTKLVVIIKNKDNDQLVEGINEIYLRKWLNNDQNDCKTIEKQYYASKEIAEMINHYDTANPELIDSLKKKIIPYLEQLQKHKLRDHVLQLESINKMSIKNFLLDFLIIWFGMPFYIAGLLLNYLPYYITKNFADKKIKHVEFYASIAVNMSMLLWVIFYGIQLLTIGLLFRNWIVLGIYALAVPVLGIYATRFYSTKKKIFGRWNLLDLLKKERTTIEKLMSQRASIIEELEVAKKNYLNSAALKKNSTKS